MKRKIPMTLLGIVLVYGSVAFAMKAAIGVLPVDAAIATLADVLHIKVGTFSMAFHGCFLLGQIAMERKNFRKTELLQILYITLGGSVLNFFLYTLLKNVSFSLYPVRLVVALVAFLVSAFGCTMVNETHLMRTPMEGCIQLIADRIGMASGKLRQRIDIGLVLLSVGLTLLFGTDWTLREGTVIAALIFGPAMDFWKKLVFTPSGKSPAKR